MRRSVLGVCFDLENYQVAWQTLEENASSQIRRVFAQESSPSTVQDDIFKLLDVPSLKPLFQSVRVHLQV